MKYRSILHPSLLCRPLNKRHNVPHHRSFSSQHSTTESELRTALTQRQMPPLYDYLTPTSASKLSNSLASFVPPSFLPNRDALSSQHALTAAKPLPPAFHLAYFNPALPEHLLLPDGTDPMQSPGQPFVRRMWAGGALRFGERDVLLDGARHACVERISDVRLKGEEGSEKVFVTIERRMGLAEEGKDEGVRQSRVGDISSASGSSEAPVVEERNIVFMRARSDDELAKAKIEMGAMETKRHNDQTKRKTTLREPTFSHVLTPTPALLFRYSALTFNAHAIHLNPSYCRDVEAHRNLLVHGPLSLTLLVTMLQARIRETRGERARISTFHYRNVAPLYVSEPMKLCGRESSSKENEVELWVENAEGVQAVRGTAVLRS